MKTFRAISASIALAIMSAFSSTANAEPSTFAYEGTVGKKKAPFTGTGHFKFAILEKKNKDNLWSNDGTPTNEPLDAVTIEVNSGVFVANIGDTSAEMAVLDSAVLNKTNDLVLRTWFSEDGQKFQKLSDFALNEYLAESLKVGESDYFIYVDSASGHDKNNGYTSARAKQTIEGAIDIIPVRVKCNITVKFAPGTYREAAALTNVGVKPGRKLLFLGDEAWSLGSVGKPAVRFTSAPNDGVGVRGADAPVSVSSCDRVSFKGISFEGGPFGLDVQHSNVVAESCYASNNSVGFSGRHGSHLDVSASIATVNDVYGHSAGGGSVIRLINGTKGTSNGHAGVRVHINSTAFLIGGGQYSNNGAGGLNVFDMGHAVFADTNNYGLFNNVHYNIHLNTKSQVTNPPASGVNTVALSPNWENVAVKNDSNIATVP